MFPGLLLLTWEGGTRAVNLFVATRWEGNPKEKKVEKVSSFFFFFNFFNFFNFFPSSCCDR